MDIIINEDAPGITHFIGGLYAGDGVSTVMITAGTDTPNLVTGITARITFTPMRGAPGQ